MKKLILTCLLGIFTLSIVAQDDAGRVSISAVQPTYENIPETARANIESKMQRMISGCGLASSEADRFIMTARIDITEKEINTAGMIVQRMEITFIVGDVIEEKIYRTTTINAMGIGETEAKCFIKAFQTIKPNNPELMAFVNNAKDDIAAYYTSNCELIIKDAERMAALQQYGEAIASLVAVPKICIECYTICQEKAMTMYQTHLKQEMDHKGKQLLQQAKAAWHVKQDYDGAAAALDLLAQIDVDASCIDEANKFIQDISSKLREDERKRAAAAAAKAKAEWEFKVRQYEDKHALAVQKQADSAEFMNTLAGRFGKIDIGIKRERAHNFGSSNR